MAKFSLNCVSYRVADELPPLLSSLGDQEKLFQCLSSPFVLMHLYRRGRSSKVLAYWTVLSRDMASIKEVSKECLLFSKIVFKFDNSLVLPGKSADKTTQYAGNVVLTFKRQRRLNVKDVV